MTKNPFINALAAALYIALVACLMFYGPYTNAPGVLVPVAVLSLLVLSALVMGYVFFATPLMMYVDGQKGEAVTLFIRTAGVFAIFTFVLFLSLSIIAPSF